jgi:PAS domain S-box-containing protein
MLSDTAAIAIDNAQLYEEVRQHTNRLEELVTARTEALRETKDRAEAILNGAGDPIVLTDVSGRVLTANPAFEEQTGYSAAKVAGLHIRRVFDVEPEQGRSARDILAEIQETTLTGERWRGELVVRRKDGTTYEADVIAGARYDQLGQVTGFVSSIRDISKLKEVDRLKDQFVSDVSHELRTPLANLKLYLHLLEQGQPRQRRYYLDTLLREQMRLEHLIENLLDLSQLDLGAVQANRALLDVGPLVQSLVLDREAAAEAQGLELITQLAVEPLFVLADGRMLVQVLDNLITNALQYTPALGKVTVRTARCPGDEHDWITISVSDTGLGISSDERDRIFERFYRGGAARQSGAQGAGLGLAICREIAERHLGSIEVESEPDVGSTFTVYLPSTSDLDLPAALETPSWDRAATIVLPEAASTLDEPSVELQPPQAVGPRVLVVEDEVHLLLGLREALTDAGYQVWTARDGLEGLERLEEVQPDLIISDVMMPRMDGFEFCQTVRARPEGVAIPFIFLTAKGQREARRQGLELGAEDYVIKPFELDDLLHLIDVRLQRSVELWAVQQTEMADLKRNISTMLGHELRTPLTYITTYTSLLGEDGTDLDDAQFRRVLKGIQHGSERLGRLVLDFLRLVDLETGVAASNYNLNRVVLDDPGDFIIQVVEKYRSQAQAAGLILRISLAPAGPLPAIVADPTYLSDALGRLLDNAIKFSSPRGKQVTIRIEVRDQELQVAVSDEGIGIPSDQLEQIFTPFYQVGREQREQSGIGAGLAIVRGIVDLHGGRVAVESQVDVGSTFTIYLPVLTAPFNSDYSHNSGNSF